MMEILIALGGNTMRTIAALLLLVSVNAYACPELTGSYTCTYQDGSSEVLSISQENKDGVTVYNYNGSMIPADNKVYPVPDDETLKQATFRAWCETATLKGNIVGKYYNNGALFGDLDMTLSLSLDGTSLKSVTTGALTNSGGTYPLDGSVTCARN